MSHKFNKTSASIALIGPLVAILMMMPATASAQSDRVQQLQRVADGLNSANPGVRIATFEDAMATGDRVIRQHALTLAMASKDRNLRSAAVFQAIKNSPELLMKFELISTQNESGAKIFQNATGGAVDVKIADFDVATGKFSVFSSFSNRSRDKIETNPAAISGDRFSFTLSLGQTINRGFYCRGWAKSNEGSIELTGIMACGANVGEYKITIDLIG